MRGVGAVARCLEGKWTITYGYRMACLTNHIYILGPQGCNAFLLTWNPKPSHGHPSHGLYQQGFHYQDAQPATIQSGNSCSSWACKKNVEQIHQRTNPCPVQAWPALARLSQQGSQLARAGQKMHNFSCL